ncbi:hypothetical protein BH23ACT8_BH23ACT8_04890 [soil metagenome]
MRRVAVIGPGRVGTALAMALEHAGHEVVAVAGRGQASIASFTRRVPAARVTGALDAARAGELVLVCVPDDALIGVVRDLARDEGVMPGSRWVHTSGGHGVEALRPAQLAGAGVAACHPAQTFPDPDCGCDSLVGTSWAVTAAPADLGWAAVLVTDLRGSPVQIAERDRTLYHAGLAVGANATSSIVTLARDLLLGAGVTDPDAFLALSRLALAQSRRAGLAPDAAAAVAQVLDEGGRNPAHGQGEV